MLAKYNIEYALPLNRHLHTQHYFTNDPVACEEFLSELLERKFQIESIHHDGVALPRPEADRMIKTASGMMASRHVCSALHIDAAEAHRRFGLPA